MARENSPVPYRESSLQGSENPAFGEWGLDFYRAIYPSNVNDHQSLSLTTRIPKEGMLEVWYSAPPIRKRMGDRWLDICTMRSPQFPTMVQTIGDQTKWQQRTRRCSGSSDFGVGVLLSRLSGQPFVSVVTENGSGRQPVPCSKQLEIAETERTIIHRTSKDHGWSFRADRRCRV